MGRIVLLAVCLSMAVAEAIGHRPLHAHRDVEVYRESPRGRAAAVAANVSSVTLHNAAVPGLRMPVVGIGTGGYSFSPSTPGEMWNDTTAHKAVRQWIQLGGRRIDASYSYTDQIGVGLAIKEAIAAGEVTRDELFVVSKVGSGGLIAGAAMGYNDTMVQLKPILTSLQLDYVDLLLIHWPGPPGHSKDPACIGKPATYRACRQQTWRALQDMFKQGAAKAIGVSNFEQNHLNDIIEMKELLPAINQVEFHPYWHEDALVKFCQERNITFNGYSPMSCPDWAVSSHHWPHSALQEPIVLNIAESHNADVSQVLLAWELAHGVIVNPRTQDPAHMKLNLEFEKVKLSADEIAQIAAIVPPKDSKVCPDPHNLK